jgi:hypothetical protein
MTTNRADTAATVLDYEAFDAVIYKADGTVQITVCPEASDNVLIEIPNARNIEDAQAAIVAAFTGLGRRVAANLAVI